MKLLLFTSCSSFPLKIANNGRYELVVKSHDAIGQRDDTDFDFSYLDISGLDESLCKRLIKKLRTAYPLRPWGILDLSGESDDPAWFFHEGAADYLGPGSADEGFTSQRWKRIQEFLSARGPEATSEQAVSIRFCPEERKFPGWKSIKPGTVFPFYLLYAGPENEATLKTSLGDKRFGELQNRLLQYLTQIFSSVDALLWMQSDASFLFLIPPEKARAGKVIEACLRLGLNEALISYEKLHLDFSLPLAFAIHYGEIPFQPPGKTGTLVADSINFIFHLAHQRAEGGRIVLSEEVAGGIMPELGDLFTPAEAFEGKKILQSKLFL